MGPPTKTTFSTDPVLTAEYIAGLLALQDVLGSLSLPARRFLFRSSMIVSRNFFLRRRSPGRDAGRNITSAGTCEVGSVIAVKGVGQKDGQVVVDREDPPPLPPPEPFEKISLAIFFLGSKIHFSLKFIVECRVQVNEFH